MKAIAEEVRAALRHVPASVAIVSTSHAGERHGLTATAIASVSLAPPQLLICVNRAGRGHQAIRQAGVFGLNFLAIDHQPLAQRFANPEIPREQKFDHGDWLLGTHGVPLLAAAVAGFECQVVEAIPRDTHTIFIGQVLSARRSPNSALLYVNGQYVEPRVAAPAIMADAS